MPPKKRTFALDEFPTTSGSPVFNVATRKSGSVTLRRMATHPGTSVMVAEALKELDSKKGVSKVAMENFIKRKYPSVDNIRLKYFVRRALKKGLEDGTLVRPANSTVTTGVLGKFRLARKHKASKAKVENVEPNVQKAPKVAKEAPKTKAAGIKRAAADEQLKPPKKVPTKGPSKSKKDEAPPAKAPPAKAPPAKAPPAKAPPAKRPSAKKAANEDVEEAKVTAKPKEAAAAKTRAKSKEAAAAEKNKAKVKEAATVEKTKAKPTTAKGKDAKDSDKAAPKTAAKRGRKKNAE